MQRRRTFQYIRPCTGAITAEYINRNLDAMFGAMDPSTRPRTGFSLLIDEISLEQRARYYRWDNTIGGICREHSHLAALTVDNAESIQKVAEQVREGVCHLGKEATVVAIASYSREDYHARPIIVSVTDKTEKAPAQAAWMRTLMECWDGKWEELLGPIFGFASDGDTVHRLAMHELFMGQLVDENSELWEFLGTLQGLNLQCDAKGRVADKDPKHLFKRLCTLLRSVEGILIGDVVLNRVMFAQHLLRIEGVTLEAINNLIDPSDHQNVPKAVELLEAIIRLYSEPVTDLDPTMLKGHKAIGLLAEVLHSLLTPFVDVELSLSEQVTRLSKYAHLIVPIFRRHRTSFMSNQLYADSQTMIKNIVFCIAKQKVLDAKQGTRSGFYVSQSGDDRLELSFSESRCQTHSRNHDSLELADKLSVTADIREIYNEHPEWDRGHRRLKYRKGEGVDHVNPASIKGCVLVENTDLDACWVEGKKRAKVSLVAGGFPDVDFTALFAQSNLDMLRPHGDGSHPAVAKDTDRSIIDPVEVPETLSETAPNPGETPVVLTGVPITPHVLDGPVAIELEDLLQEPEEELDEPRGHTDWLQFQGKSVHKASAIRIMFQFQWQGGLAVQINSGKKSNDRLVRVQDLAVRSYTQFNFPATLDRNNLGSNTSFCFGKLGALLIRVSTRITVGILSVTSIEVNGRRVGQIDVSDLPFTDRGMKITGQLLALRQTPADPSTSTPASWTWTNEYLRIAPFKTARTAADTITRKNMTITAPGYLIQPVNPTRVMVPDVSDTGSASVGSAITWQFSEAMLTDLPDAMWELVKNVEDILTHIPKCGDSVDLPYRNREGESMFITEAGTSLVPTQEISDEDVTCVQCHKVMKRVDIRAHVGKHILLARQNVPEEGLFEPIGRTLPCGYCGRSGTCTITLQKSTTTYQPASDCPSARSFTVSAALKGSKTTPCTNAPVLCLLCPQDPKQKERPAVWRYNMLQHICTSHANLAPPLNTPPLDVVKLTLITREEQIALGVPEARAVCDFPGPQFEAEFNGLRPDLKRKAPPDISARPKRACNGP
ncbi:hypothetical protein DFH07DRAFT_758857 [Mycena maculata]|uniref:Uncharacterized protein n=1 Tax=Mycena maculata TaxID=230809 RepID=A0AAD7MMY3_9AGAR|nr:hypothetical protein DFH07DRAFT_758857 [Mycena maculata]